MADPQRRTARRRARRRRTLVAAGVGAVVVAGAGTAWAMTGSDNPSYRLAGVARADITQHVDADGRLVADDTATAAFATSGTVASVRVAVGDRVSAGQTLATLDRAGLQLAVTAAENTVAQAEQRRADDEQAQANGAAVTSAARLGAADPVPVVLVAANRPLPTALQRAQRQVETAQHDLDAAVADQDRAVTALVSSCAATDEKIPITSSATADAAGTVSGAAGAAAVLVTLRNRDGDVVGGPQQIAPGGRYAFTGLTAGDEYTVQIVRTEAVDTTACATAVTAVRSAESRLDDAQTASQKALRALSSDLAHLPGTAPSGGSTASPRPGGNTPSSHRTATSGGGTSTGGNRVSGAAGSAGGTTSGTRGRTITAEQLAADTKTVDAANAALAVAQHDLTLGTLTTPISGVVASVTIAPGATVSASSSSATIRVVGEGTLSVPVDIDLADIDLVKVGQRAAVTVDGRSAPLPATVSLVGSTNASGGSGSAAAYPVTVTLDPTDTVLYDGMGASVAITVGTARNVLSVPVSAMRTLGNLHTVQVDDHGSVTTKQVKVGVGSDDRVQITSGLTSGDRVVLADLSAAVPSSTAGTGNRRGGSLTGLTGGGLGRFGGAAGGFGQRAGGR